MEKEAPLYNENLPRERYTRSEYNHGARWMSYFHQIKLITTAKCSSVLEIGPGHGWTVGILRDLGLEVKTVDINPALRPDYVAPIDALPLPDNAFDIVCAFEVLEHMPFERFVRNLTEMARVAKRYVIISLPDHRRTLINASIKLPFLPTVILFFKVPTFRTHRFNGRHYWEIGKRGYPPSRIKQEIEKTGLCVQKMFVPADAPTNHYFVMEKR